MTCLAENLPHRAVTLVPRPASSLRAVTSTDAGPDDPTGPKAGRMAARSVRPGGRIGRIGPIGRIVLPDARDSSIGAVS